MSLRSFEELEVYKKARVFRKEVSVLCKALPKEELYKLVDQMKRASRSVTNQIAEGCGRFHYQENIQFCRIARGSLDEMHDHLNICLDEDFITEEQNQKLKLLKNEIRRMLNGYIAYLAKAKKVDSDK